MLGGWVFDFHVSTGSRHWGIFFLKGPPGSGYLHFYLLKNQPSCGSKAL